MSQKSGTPKLSSERIVKDIRRATRVQYSAEEKIRVVLDGLRGEHSWNSARREGIAESLYLHLVEGLPGGRQTAPCGRYRAGGYQRRGQGPAPGSQGAGSKLRQPSRIEIQASYDRSASGPMRALGFALRR